LIKTPPQFSGYILEILLKSCPLWQIGEREGRLLEIGDRNSIEFPEQVSLDVRYIESQSIWRDILILIKTVPAVLLGKGGA